LSGQDEDLSELAGAGCDLYGKEDVALELLIEPVGSFGAAPVHIQAVVGSPGYGSGR
jgi:hypothetical protein